MKNTLRPLTVSLICLLASFTAFSQVDPGTIVHGDHPPIFVDDIRAKILMIEAVVLNIDDGIISISLGDGGNRIVNSAALLRTREINVGDVIGVRVLTLPGGSKGFVDPLIGFIDPLIANIGRGKK